MDSLFQNPDLVAGLCGVAMFVVVVIIWSALLDKDPLAERLKAVAEHRSTLAEAALHKESRRIGLQRKHMIKRAVDWLKLSQGKSLDELRLKLQRAGYRSHDTIFAFLLIKFLMLVGGGAFGAFFFFVLHVGKFKPEMALFMTLAAALAGWMLPDLFVKNATQKREDALRQALPDALDLLVICAEAGLSLDAGFERVSREMGQSSPELAEELGLTAVELSFLPERQKALQGLAERVALPSVLALVNTLLQTEKYGTPLAQALRVLSAEMREDRMMRAEEKAARLPAILTVPMIVFILPPLFVVLLGPAILKVMAIFAKH